MKFTNNQMEIARIYFGLPEKCLYRLPETLEEGLESIAGEAFNIGDKEVSESIGRKVVALSNLFSLLSAKIMDDCYTNEVSQTLFRMAKEAKDSGSKTYKKASPELRAILNRVMAEIK